MAIRGMAIQQYIRRFKPSFFRIASTKPAANAMIVAHHTAIIQSCCENAYKTRHPAAMPDIMAGPPGCDTITLPDACAFGTVSFLFFSHCIKIGVNKTYTIFIWWKWR